MARRRRTQSQAQDRAGSPAKTARGGEEGPVNADTLQAVAGADPEQPAVPEHAPTTHEALLEGVSPDALIAAGGGGDEPALGSDTPEAATPDSADLAEDLTVVPEDTATPVEAASEAVETAAGVVETVAQSLPETVPEVRPAASPIMGAQAARGRVSDLATDLATSPRISEVMSELGEANTTVLTYLRGEGAAAMAHWQALSAAKTPADAIRLQVTEMQRAADASLSCFAALARRAGRFTGALARR